MPYHYNRRLTLPSPYNVPLEGKGLAPGELFTTRDPGRRESVLQDVPAGAPLTIRGGPQGVGVFEGTGEEGGVPSERTLAYIRSAAPPPAEALPEEEPSPELGTTEWAKAEWQGRQDEHQSQLDERKKILSRASELGASLKAVEGILKRKGLDNLKEPKLPEWLAEMAQDPTLAEQKAGVFAEGTPEQQARATFGAGEQPEFTEASAREEVANIDKQIADLEAKKAEGAFFGEAEGDTTASDRAISSLNNYKRYLEEQFLPGAPTDTRFGEFRPDELFRDLQGQAAPREAQPTATKELGDEDARRIFAEAGGDPERARSIARERGFNIGG